MWIRAKDLLAVAIAAVLTVAQGSASQARAPSAAPASNLITTDHAKSAFWTETHELVRGETVWVVLHQELRDGWHVYWENPGDSGLPLDLRWDLPQGVAAGAAVYPTPEHIPVGPLANFGHHGAPAFLIPITTSADFKGPTARLSVAATWLICEEICVPEDGVFSWSMPVSDAPRVVSENASLFRDARLATPASVDWGVEVRRRNDAIVVTLGGQSVNRQAAKPVYFFPAVEGLIEPAAAQRVSVRGRRIEIEMKAGFAANTFVAGPDFRGVLRFADGAGVVVSGENGLSVASAADGASASIGLGALVGLFAAAFFGGALLNLMPCVFPILFIKAAALVRSAAGDAVEARRHGLYYVAGVVATFAGLGALLLALRAGGAQLGWGFHLQSPIVVLMSAYILLLVGLNLAGVFEIGESLQNVGGGFAKADAGGAFLTGVLAVFVAAPCIGPLLSAPMAATLTLPPPVGFSIFVVMALGLAAPYAILSFVPALGRFLPRPGPWMAVFRQALSFPVFGAAAFFLWVLSHQAGGAGLATGLAGGVLLAFGAWLFQRSKEARGKGGAWRLAAGLALVAALLPGLRLGDLEAFAVEGRAGSLETASAKQLRHGAFRHVAPFTSQTLADARSAGGGVFIDFTAAWCVTCQFNKLTVFSRASIADAFDAAGVSVLVADWTRRDPVITQALEEFGANGVPLYVYFPPEGEAQIVPLPVTEQALLRLVEKKNGGLS